MIISNNQRQSFVVASSQLESYISVVLSGFDPWDVIPSLSVYNIEDEVVVEQLVSEYSLFFVDASEPLFFLAF